MEIHPMPGSDAVLHMSRIEFEFRLTQSINLGKLIRIPNLIQAELIYSSKYTTTNENCKFGSIHAFDLAHVKYDV